nr:MAG TPA: hypothetical protein [Bacteriophage sp.]DAH31254.1 MAG TPA: hypothetical protein [Bacteriophage sp.]
MSQITYFGSDIIANNATENGTVARNLKSLQS